MFRAGHNLASDHQRVLLIVKCVVSMFLTRVPRDWKVKLPWLVSETRRSLPTPSGERSACESWSNICIFLSSSSFFNFLMLSIKDWTSLVQSLVDSGCTISAEVKVRVQFKILSLSFLLLDFLSVKTFLETQKFYFSLIKSFNSFHSVVATYF